MDAASRGVAALPDLLRITAEASAGAAARGSRLAGARRQEDQGRRDERRAVERVCSPEQDVPPLLDGPV